MGIRCCYGAPARTKVVLTLVGTTEHDAMKANDLQILDESMLEFACEGKVYAMMNRTATSTSSLTAWLQNTSLPVRMVKSVAKSLTVATGYTMTFD